MSVSRKRLGLACTLCAWALTPLIVLIEQLNVIQWVSGGLEIMAFFVWAALMALKRAVSGRFGWVAILSGIFPILGLLSGLYAAHACFLAPAFDLQKGCRLGRVYS